MCCLEGRSLSFHAEYAVTCRVKEQAGALDERFKVKRKLRNLVDDAARKWPMVSLAGGNPHLCLGGGCKCTWQDMLQTCSVMPEI